MNAHGVPVGGAGNELWDILRQLPDAVGIVDLQGRWIFTTPRMANYVPGGIPSSVPERIQRWRIFDVQGRPVPPEDWPGRRALRGETVSPGLHALYRNDEGNEEWVSISAAPLRDATGALVGATCVIRSIDTAKRVQEALARSEQRFRALVLASADQVFRMSADWTEIHFIHGAEIVAGSFKTTTGWLEKYIHTEDRALFSAVVAEAIQRRDKFELEHRVMRTDGTVGWTHTRAIPIRDADGRLLEWFCSAKDVTARRQIEEALRESDRRKDEFLAILAHELRNPLTPIANGLQLLERIAPGAPGEAQVRAMMGRQLRHMVRLIDDLLDVSRITRGKIELKKERISLGEAVKQAVEANRPVLEERQHELQLRMPRESVLVDADATRLAQVISNLLNNAAKYTGVRGRIAVGLRQDGEEAVLSVADTGQGIPAEMLGKVFNLFTQADDQAVPCQGGLGIGLSIVKGLIELHGGSVQAESAGGGKGSTFVVRLPLARDHRAAPIAAPSPAPEIGARKVLVVDDNVDAADSLARLLSLAGSEARVAYDGDQAIAVAQEFRPDVILLDIGLPKKNGYEVCRAIRRSPGGEAPVIVALSGWGQEQDRMKSGIAGFDAHLVKPADFNEIARTLRDAGRQGIRSV